MKTYLVQILVESTLRLPDHFQETTITDNDGRWKITIENFIEEWPELEVKKYFLRCWVEVSTETMEESRVLAASYLEELLDAFSFVLSNQLSIFRVISITDWTKGLKTRTHRTFWPSLFPNKLRVEVNKEFFEKSVALLDEHKIPKNIPRAMRLFRNGLIDLDPIDRFMDFYVSIEIIAETLKTKEKTKGLCPTCHKEGFFRPSGRKAIEDIVVNKLGRDIEFAETIRGIRNACSHGGDLDAVLKERNINQAEFFEYSEKLKQVCIDAICLAIELDPKALILRETKLGVVDFEQIMQCDWTSDDPSDVDEPKIRNIPDLSLVETDGPTESPRDRKFNPNLVKKLFF